MHFILVRLNTYYNSPNLRFSVYLLPHKIGSLEGIGSRHFVPVEGFVVHVLRGVPFT